MTHEGKQRAQTILAAEDDDELSHLALSFQVMFSCVKWSAQSSWTPIRKTDSKIFGLLVRQGLLATQLVAAGSIRTVGVSDVARGQS